MPACKSTGGTGQRFRYFLSAGWLIASLVTILSDPAAAQAGTFTFGFPGDLAYQPSEEPLLVNVLNDLNNDTQLSFVVHIGDLSSHDFACANSLLTKRFNQFQASVHPFIYTPGDNEWTDCANALNRLDVVRSVFFKTGRTLGQTTFPLARQSADPAYTKYRENARWDKGGVTFMTIHVVGSNNGLGRDSAGDAEFAERNAANLEWLKRGFAHAKAANSRAVMVFQQADMFPNLPPYEGDAATGFADIKRVLKGYATSFEKPIVLAHGDSHFFRIDKPFSMADHPYFLNFTRVETFGSPFHHWIHVTVNPQDPNVFIFSPRIVKANLLQP